MKIGICSDLHLEFGPLEIKNPGDVDILILSGDICVERNFIEAHGLSQDQFGQSLRYHEFFQQCSREFPHVIYISGNHEHYSGDYKYTVSDLKSKLAYLSNLHVLEKETFELNDTVFVCGTLWTDMNKEDSLTLFNIRRMMNDFRCIKNSNKEVTFKAYDLENNAVFKTRPAIFSPEDSVEDHKKMLAYIKIVYDTMSAGKQMVVVGHHTPSHLSCHPRFRDDREMNGGYHSDLSEFILDRPKIKLWTHGHTHESFDYKIGDTRVVCNPRGYSGHEAIADTFELKVVEI